jgi:hypothetical protein
MSKYSAKDAANKELVHEVAEKVKTMIQDRIDAEIENREWIYFPPVNKKTRK